MERPTNILVGSSLPLARLRRHPNSGERCAQNTLHPRPFQRFFKKTPPKICLGLYFMYAQVQYPGSILFSLVRRSKQAEYAMWGIHGEVVSWSAVYMAASLAPGADALGTMR